MPSEPTFSRSHLSTFRNSLMATTTATKKTSPLPQQVASPALTSCCHRQRHATHSPSESSPCTASSKDEARSPTSESLSCASSSASSSSPPSSPPPSRPASVGRDTSAPPVTPQSRFSPVPGSGAKKDPDGTISPATIHQHYACVARRLFRVLGAEDQPHVASPHPKHPTASAKTRPSAQATAPRALDWTATTATTLDELPVSANRSLPEYQLTQEWFERVVGELREVEESEAAAAAVAAACGGGEDVGTDVDGGCGGRG